MKIVIQRVSAAAVRIDNKVVGKITEGLMLLIGVAQNDSMDDVLFAANKCVDLRIFEDEEGKMNRSLVDTGGAVLAISQFTLLGDTRKGRRPSFISAADPEKGKQYYEKFVTHIRERGIHVETGIFGAMMDVEFINTGPVTIIVDTNHKRS